VRSTLKYLAETIVLLNLSFSCVHRKPVEPLQNSRGAVEAFGEHSWFVMANDFWDATEQQSLFYFPADYVLRALGHECPNSAPKPSGQEWEYELVPWLQHVCRTPGAHSFPREGGLEDPAATMFTLRENRVQGLVCCGHSTFTEMGHPGNYQLVTKGGQWQCAEGQLVSLDDLIPVGTIGLRCGNRLVWPDITPKSGL